MGETVGAMDRRVERSRAAVLDATYRLMTAGGLANVSVDAVAKHSGVAKTTIYRHWPSRGALLLEACSTLGRPVEPPDTGDTVLDLRLLARGLVIELATAQWPAILPSIIDAAERDPAVAEMQAMLNARFMAPFAAVIERGLHRGQIGAGLAADEIIAGITGPLFYRRWFSKEELDERLADRAVERALGLPTG